MLVARKSVDHPRIHQPKLQTQTQEPTNFLASLRQDVLSDHDFFAEQINMMGSSHSYLGTLCA
jgi:hypothetical protein